MMVLLLGVLMLAGCSSSGTNPNATATTTADTGTTGNTAGTETTAPGQTTTSSGEGEERQEGEAQQEVTVNIANFAFTPATVTIKKGGKITWTNNDSVAHTATGRNNEFDSGTLNNGQSFTQTFNNAGTFNYYCTLHPSMTGTIVVE